MKKNRRKGGKKGLKNLWKKRPGSKKGNKKLGRGNKKGGKSQKKKKPFIKKKPTIKKIVKNSNTTTIKELKTRKTNITVKAGKILFINCAAKYFSSNPKPLFSIMWHQNGTKLTNSKAHIYITTKDKHPKPKVLSSLRIRPFDAARDKGTYTCSAVDLNGKVLKSIDIHVNLKQKPSI